MKKTICYFLGMTLLLSALFFTGCNSQKKDALRLGLGLYTSAEASSAAEDKNGTGVATATAAAVLLDTKGRITACLLDSAESAVSYTASGKALANESFLTKREQGDSYGMKAYGGAVKEWYEQADTFSSLTLGKTIEEIKALVAEDGKGNDEVIRAGCTISVSDFVMAIEKAVQNASPAELTAKDQLKLSAATIQTTKDAEGEENGFNQIETTFFAATTDANGKITSSYSDCVQVEFTFDSAGISQNSGKWIISSKRDLKNSYGMKTYGGAEKEWYEQADVFGKACIGKTAQEISSLLNQDGHGTDTLQTAGCTINIDGFVKAASKIK